MGELAVRAATPGDLDGIMPVLQASLGWTDDASLTSFFRWKHEQSSFGASRSWVAEDDGEIVGFRTFLRWRFLVDGRPVTAVRAVDTATRPDQQRRGIFSRLTMLAVEESIADGVGFVFNTPNAASGAGYLKMGWQEVGHIPLAVRPRPTGLLTHLTWHPPAERLSIPSTSGDDASAVLADGTLADLVASQPAVRGVVTDRTPEHLRWRYGFEPLHYRAVTGPGGVRDGVAVFRLRRRGPLRAAQIAEVLAPDGDPRVAASLVRRAARASRGDVAVCVPSGHPAGTTQRAGFVTTRSRGPLLVWRALNETERPVLDEWQLSLGDAELF